MREGVRLHIFILGVHEGERTVTLSSTSPARIAAIAAERVAAGAALLDRLCPEWESRINLAVLHIDRPGNCIVGQAYGDFDRGVQEIAAALGTLETGMVCIKHGFIIDEELLDGTKEGTLRAYDELTYAWTRLIRARRESHGNVRDLTAVC